MLTLKQKQIMEYLKKYMEKKDYSPSLQEIGKHFKLAKSTIHKHVKNLKERGYLNKDDYKARAINIFDKGELVSIPLLGMISAGQQVEMFEQQGESIAIPKTNTKPNQSYFGLKVSGESMIEKNIDDGDTVLIKQQSTANNGDNIIALIDNNETTLKTFYKENGHIRLQPANKNMQPIIIENNRDFSIQGVIADVIKNENNLLSKNLFITEKIKNNDSLPLNKIILGDAVEELKKLPSETCDVIIIDPPYNIGKDFGNNIDKRGLREYIDWSKVWINESIRILKPTGTMFIYL